MKRGFPLFAETCGYELDKIDTITIGSTIRAGYLPFPTLHTHSGLPRVSCLDVD